MLTVTLPALVVNPNRNRYGLRAPKGTGCRVNGRFYRPGCFCPAYQIDNPLELPVIQVADASYLLEILDPSDTCSAVRLTKLTTRQSYRVERHADGHQTCECRGFEFRGTCRHTAANLLPAPVAAETMVENIPQLAPVTLGERLADRFVARLVLDAQEDRVAAIVCPLIERHRAIHESGPASPEALVRVALNAWQRMDAEDRESFTEWASSIGYPSDWCDFILECRDGSPVEFGPDDYRPEPEPFAPSFEEEREWAGLLEGEEAREYEAWLDGLAQDREEEAFAYAGPRETDGFEPGFYS